MILAGAPPQTLLGELTALPQTSQLDLKGPATKGIEGERRGEGAGGEEWEGREREKGSVPGSFSQILAPDYDNTTYRLTKAYRFTKGIYSNDVKMQITDVGVGCKEVATTCQMTGQ